MVVALLTTFSLDAPGRFADLERAVQARDAKAIERAAHAFKSGAGTILATFLADMLAQIENAARAGRLETVAELAEQLRREHQGRPLAPEAPPPP